MLQKCLLLLCGLAVIGATIDKKTSVLSKTFHSDYFDRLVQNGLEENVNGNAVVLKSNLPVAVQNKLAATLTSIYQTTQNSLQRAQAFQSALSQTYSLYWNVIINFDVITFYSQYYILLQIDQDRVLGFGMS